MLQNMSKLRHIVTSLLLLCLLALPVVLEANPIRVNITRKSNPLPPNAGELQENFGRYFNVSLTNTSGQVEVVRLELNVQGPHVIGEDPQNFPNTPDHLMVHSTMALPTGFIVGAHQTQLLSEFELTTHFKQYLGSALSRTGELAQLLDEDSRGFGLLPEGHYGVQLLAYSNEPSRSTILLGNGHTYFDIAYKASAPLFVRPTGAGMTSNCEAVIKPSDMMMPYLRFEWMEPKFNLGATAGARNFLYDLQISVIPHGATDVTQCSGAQFVQNGLLSNFCDVPISEMRALESIDEGNGFAVRVRARSLFADTRSQYYSMIDNDGYSNWMRLTFAKNENVNEDEKDRPGDDSPEVSVDSQSTEEIKLTITPKASTLPIELETYFAQPSMLFNVAFDNTGGPARDVVMALQFYKDNDGFMVKPKLQHRGRILQILANECRSLTDDEVDRLMGGYQMNEVIDFKAQTGYLGNITTKYEFPDSPDNVCCRMALPDGDKAITSCTVVARGKAEFVVGKDDSADGQQIDVTVERTQQGVYSDDVAHYFDDVENYFKVKLHNNSMRSRDVMLQLHVVSNLTSNLYYGYSNESRYLDRMLSCHYHIPACGDKEFTVQELHEACGGFPYVYSLSDNRLDRVTDEVYFAGSYKMVAEVFDFEQDAQNLQYDDTYGYYLSSSKARLGRGEVDFGTESVDMSVAWKSDTQAPPCKTAGYFDVPGNSMNLTIKNNSDQPMKVLPVLTLLHTGQDASNPLYEVVGAIDELNERAKTAPLQIESESALELKDVALSAVLGKLKKVTARGKNAGTTAVNEYALIMGPHTVRVDLYDVTEYDGTKDVTQCNLVKTDYLMFDMSDLVVKFSLKGESVPSATSNYFLTPAEAFDVSLCNLSGEKRDVTLQLVVNDLEENSFQTFGYNENDGKLKERTLSLTESAEEVKLTAAQINKLLGGYQQIWYGGLTEGEPKVWARPEEKISVKGHYIPRGENWAKLYAYPSEKTAWITAPGRDACAGDSVFFHVQTVAMDLKAKQSPLPVAADAYFGKKPSDYFALTLTNTTNNDMVLLPRLSLQKKGETVYRSGSDYFKPNQSARFVTLPANGKLELTAEMIDAAWGGHESVEVRTAAPDDPTQVTVMTEKLEDVLINPGDYNVIVDLYEKTEDAELEKSCIETDSIQVAIGTRGVIKTLVTVKDDHKLRMPTETLEYFKNPGEYFDVKLVNKGVEDLEIGLDFVYNDTLVATSVLADEERRTLKVPGRGTKAVADTLVLTKEQVNRLVGEWEAKDIRRKNHLTQELEVPAEYSIGTGSTKLRAVAFSRKENGDTLGIDDTSFEISLGEVKINDFVLHLTKSELKGKDKGGNNIYKGEGYIGYSPLGFEIKMAVEFDTIHVNDDHVVTAGYVRTQQRKGEKQYIPYNWFEQRNPSSNQSEEEAAELAKIEAQTGQMASYFNWALDGCDYVSDCIGILADQPVTLPLGIDSTQQVMKDVPVAMQMVSAAWTPTESWINLMAEYKMPDVNAVKASDPNKNNLLVLAAPFLKINHDDKALLPETGMMALISDVTFIDQGSGFEMTCKAPSKFKTLDDLRRAEDGCFIKWKDSQFEALTLDASIAIPELQRSDEDGNLLDASNNKVTDSDLAARPDVRLTAQIAADGDWIGQVRMGAFQVPDAKGFTFIPTGTEGGIVYDHSRKTTPAGVTFSDEYNFKKEEIAGKWTKEKKEKWMGLYWEKMAVRFPDWLPTVGKDSSNIVISAEKMMYDASGFSSNFVASKVIDAELDGWAISLDNIHLSVIQNNFGGMGFDGNMQVPFLVGAKDDEPGKIAYRASVTRLNEGRDEGSIRMQFQTIADPKGLRVGFLPVVNMDFGGSYFDLTYTNFAKPELHGNETDSLSIALVLNGKMGLQSDEEVGFHLPDIHFYKMYVANHVMEDDDFLKDMPKEDKDGALLRWEGPTWHNGGADKKKATIALSAGNWSLASMSKKIGPFEFSLNKFEVAKNTTVDQHKVSSGIYVEGGVNVMDGIGGATAGLTLNFDIDFETKKCSMRRPDFGMIAVEAVFGGAKLAGQLTSVANSSTSKLTGAVKATSGYEGMLDLKLPGGLMEFRVEGGYYKAQEDSVEFAAGYLEAKMDGNIPMGPVSLTGITGGFYINCAKRGDNIVLNRGEYGGMFGLNMADGSGKLITGGFQLFVFYDTRAVKYVVNVRNANDSIIGTKTEYSGRLSEVRLIGTMHVITENANSDSGIINAKAQILYVHRGGNEESDDNNLDLAEENESAETQKDEPEEHFFELTITVDLQSPQDMASSEFGNKIKELVGDIPEADLTAYTATGDMEGMKDEDKSHEDKEKTEPKKDQVSDPRYSSKTQINLTFHIDFIKKDGRCPWYLYMGTPDERCTYSIINFKLGNGTVGVGALMGANSYICIGNKLPDAHAADGTLVGFPPPLPPKVQEFLDQSVQGFSQNESHADQRQFHINPSSTNGGLMFGGEIYGDFWCNALICYAEAGFDAGIDLQLVSQKNPMICAESMKPAGKNGWYGQGQLYAYMHGELGVMIKFLGKTNRYPIVKLGAGGVLKAGLPNPTWFYGKFRAKGSIFGGLIKFNRSIEVKAGSVCTPLVSSPLDDIDIFSDCTPGLDEEREGHDAENAVSPNSSIIFTTNMELDSPMELMDENILAQVADKGRDTKLSYRTFKFVGTSFVIEKLHKSGKNETWEPVNTICNQYDATTYRLMHDGNYTYFDENSKYRITLIGRAFEKINNVWQNPMFVSLKDEEQLVYSGSRTTPDNGGKPKMIHAAESYQSVWFDTAVYYFNTGAISKDLKDHIKIVCGVPRNQLDVRDYLFDFEACYPYLCLDRKMKDIYVGKNQKLKVRVMRPYMRYKPEDQRWTYDSDHVETIHEFDVDEQILDDGVRWSAVGKARLGKASYDTYIDGKWIERNHLGEDVLKEGKVMMPYVMRFVLVNEKQTQGKRRHADVMREHALSLINKDKTTSSNESNTSVKRFDSRQGNTGRTTVGDVVSGKKTRMDSYSSLEEQFLSDITDEISGMADTVNINNTITDKMLDDQSESILWEGMFSLWRNYDKKKDTEQLVSTFADAFDKESLGVEPLLEPLFYVSPQRHSVYFDDKVSYFVKLDSIGQKKNASSYFYNKKLSDYDLLCNYVPNDPFTVMGFASVLGFYDGPVYNHRYILKKFAYNNPQSPIKMQFVKNGAPAYILSADTLRTYSEMSLATNMAQLKNSYDTYELMQKWIPTEWDQVGNTGYGYARKPGEMPCLGKNTNTLLTNTKDYLHSFVNVVLDFAEEWSRANKAFRQAAGITNSNSYLPTNNGKARDWGDTYRIGNLTQFSGSFYTDNNKYHDRIVSLEFDMRQLPFLYARYNAIHAFWEDGDNADRNAWFRSGYDGSNWTQRMLYDGKFRFFTPKDVLVNQAATYRFLPMWNKQMDKITEGGVIGTWYTNLQYHIRQYRPNHFNTRTQTYGVANWDEHSNESTNTRFFIVKDL